VRARRELPDPQICEQARLSREARVDGRFFTGVLSTRIYCRPVCPARWANRVVYFTTAASAEAAGYRPCLRCRPELSPSDGAWRRSDLFTEQGLAYQRVAARWGVTGAIALLAAFLAAWLLSSLSP
jgi:AraC family transcriptional regulator of adaptative response / DNA-3-methyladenine glycosylase II